MVGWLATHLPVHLTVLSTAAVLLNKCFLKRPVVVNVLGPGLGVLAGVNVLGPGLGVLAGVSVLGPDLGVLVGVSVLGPSQEVATGPGFLLWNSWS